MAKLLRSLIRSRLGQSLFVLHLCVWFICVYQLRGLTSEQIDASIYGTVLFWVAMINFPATLGFQYLFRYLGVNAGPVSDIVYGVLISIPWWIFGCIVASIFRGIKNLLRSRST